MITLRDYCLNANMPLCTLSVALPMLYLSKPKHIVNMAATNQAFYSEVAGIYSNKTPIIGQSKPLI